MKRALILALFLSLAAATSVYGGFFCCGGGGGSSEETSADLTADEQVAAADMVMSEMNISQGVENAILGNVAAMAMRKASALKETMSVTIDCDTSGILTITSASSGSGSSYTAVFDHCGGTIQTLTGATIAFSMSGSIRIEGTTTTYGADGDTIRVEWACDTGGSPIQTCYMTGTITGVSDMSEYNLSGYCGASSFTHTGSMTGTLRAADNHFAIFGVAVYTVSGSSSGRIVRCRYDDFDVTAATCADYAAACGLSPTVACANACQ